MAMMTKTQPRKSLSFRKLHRILAPIMLAPILLTQITGTLYQIVDLLGKNKGFGSLLDLHKGNFGPLHLEIIYPFLNVLGLLGLTMTGFSMWRQISRRQNRQVS